MPLFMCFTFLRYNNRLRAGHPGFSSLEGKDFSLFHSVQTGSGAHQVSYPKGTRSSFLGGKRAGAWISHLQLVPRSRKLELYLNSLICFHGILFNLLITGTTFLSMFPNLFILISIEHVVCRGTHLFFPWILFLLIRELWLYCSVYGFVQVLNRRCLRSWVIKRRTNESAGMIRPSSGPLCTELWWHDL
jgi:hypothetical protein